MDFGYSGAEFLDHVWVVKNAVMGTVDDEEVIEALGARIPHVQKVEIPDAAHMLPAECGPDFSSTLLDLSKSLNL